MRILFLFYYSICFGVVSAQDTSIKVANKVVQMPVAFVRSNMNVQSFMHYAMNDTSFYKAFRNLRILQFSMLNDIKIFKKDGTPQATLYSEAKQVVKNNCRSTLLSEEKTTGNFYTKKKEYNYYTARLYASLFFAPTPICGENNIVGDGKVSTKGLSGIEKRKQQLKMLFFNPGARIRGIPFMGDKTSLYDDDMNQYYNYKVEGEDYLGRYCYKFSTIAKDSLTSSQRNKIVIDEMTTWFDANDMQIMGRQYTLSYRAGLYDFDVEMAVEMGKYKHLTVPVLIRYKGDWDIAFKKRERAQFTATIFDFND
jgi:hypothetical protein